MALSRPFKGDRWELPLSTPLLQAIDGVMILVSYPLRSLPDFLRSPLYNLVLSFTIFVLSLTIFVLSVTLFILSLTSFVLSLTIFVLYLKKLISSL